MKAAANGILNVSILDGWWCEGYSPETGWAIGGTEEYNDHAYQDTTESQALYNILENDVIPCFYDRDSGGVPGTWLNMMKASMIMAIDRFCAHRMVNIYNTRFYVPAAKRHYELIQDNAAKAQALRDQHERLRRLWPNITIEQPGRQDEGPFRVGKSLVISTNVHLGELTPEEVNVELYYGPVRDLEHIAKGRTETMTVKQDLGNGNYQYECALTCQKAGRFGFTVRVTPEGDDYIRNTPGLITWA
jgi:glycogen phosphorylase